MSTLTPDAPASPDTTPVHLRPAETGDYDAAAGLFRALMGESFTLDAALWNECVTSHSGDGAHQAYVATLPDTGEVVGLTVVIVSDRIRLASGTHRKRFHIDQLIVRPDQRRKGIGHALLMHVLGLAAEAAPSYILVNCDFTNVAARKVYEGAGLYLVRQSSDRFEIAFS